MNEPKGITGQILDKINTKEIVDEWGIPLAVGGAFTATLVVPPLVEALTWAVGEFWLPATLVGGGLLYRRHRQKGLAAIEAELESDPFDQVFKEALGADDVDEELAELKKKVRRKKSPVVTFGKKVSFWSRRKREKLNVLDRIMQSRKPHFMIAGATGAGKTTLVKHIVQRRANLGHQVLIIDPHNKAGAWGKYEVLAGGEDWDGYLDVLEELRKRMTQTYRDMDRGFIQEEDIQPLTVYLGEWDRTYFELGKRAAHALISLVISSRKTGIRLLIDTHSTLVKALGFEGKGDLRESLGIVHLALAHDGTYLAEFEGEKVDTAGPFQGWLGASDQVASDTDSSAIGQNQPELPPDAPVYTPIQQPSVASHPLAPIQQPDTAESASQQPIERVTSTPGTAESASQQPIERVTTTPGTAESASQQPIERVTSKPATAESAYQQQVERVTTTPDVEDYTDGPFTPDELIVAFNSYVFDDVSIYQLVYDKTGKRQGKAYREAKSQIETMIRRRLTR